MTSVNTIARIFDYNATAGGPILRDRLWFYTSWRLWGVWDPPANTNLDDGSRYVPERQIWSPIIRLTTQITPANKFSVHFDRQAKGSGPELTAVYPAAGWIAANSPDFDRFVTNSGVDDPETARSFQDPSPSYGVAQGKFTSTISSRLLFEAGYSMSRTYVLTKAPAGVAVPIGNSLGLAPIDQTTLWYARTAKRDLDTGNTDWNATAGVRRKPIRHSLSASLSYVTGSHTFKVGVQNASGGNQRFYGGDVNGHIDRVQYRSGVPTSACHELSDVPEPLAQL